MTQDEEAIKVKCGCCSNSDVVNLFVVINDDNSEDKYFWCRNCGSLGMSVGGNIPGWQRPKTMYH